MYQSGKNIFHETCDGKDRNTEEKRLHICKGTYDCSRGREKEMKIVNEKTTGGT